MTDLAPILSAQKNLWAHLQDRRVHPHQLGQSIHEYNVILRTFPETDRPALTAQRSRMETFLPFLAEYGDKSRFCHPVVRRGLTAGLQFLGLLRGDEEREDVIHDRLSGLLEGTHGQGLAPLAEIRENVLRGEKTDLFGAYSIIHEVRGSPDELAKILSGEDLFHEIWISLGFFHELQVSAAHQPFAGCLRVNDFYWGDKPVLVYPRCDGNLEDIQPDTLPGLSAEEVLSQIFDGLKECHRRGVIHGDLRGKNIFFKGGKVFLADFGKAHYMEDYNALPGRFRILLGRRDRYAPEWIHGYRGSKDDESVDVAAHRDVSRLFVSPKTDMYTLGITLYLWLTHQNDLYCETVYPYLDELRSSKSNPILDRMNPDLAPVLAKAIALDPDHRYKDIGTMQAALKARGQKWISRKGLT